MRRENLLLVLILLVAAVSRLVNLGQSPPGTHVDAAANAWNAWCLLETGRDWLGTPWPIVYSQGFGEYQTTLYYYVLLPVQAIAGLSYATTPVPSAIGGVVTVLLVYWVGARWFGRPAGLMAGALLAVTPWHLLCSRTGHEAGLTPLLTVGPLAALLAANLPLDDPKGRSPRPVLAGLAGLSIGVACYGYLAARVFLATFLVLAVLATGWGWWALLRSRRGRMALSAFLLALVATVGPLVWRHLTDPGVAKRGREFLLWQPSDPLGARVERVLGRYAQHFGPDFLFRRGDPWILHSIPGSGPFQWYLLPLMLLGAVALVREAPSSRAARVLLVWLLVYPLTDSFTQHEGVNAFRSSPGVCGLILLAAVGSVRAWAWLRERGRPAALSAAVGMALAFGALNARFLHGFYVDYNRRPDMYQAYNVDLLEACEWLRPRLVDVDAVFFPDYEAGAISQPFVITLVGLRYDPRQWFADEREVRERPDTNLTTRYGKMHFLFDSSDLAALDELQENGRPDRVLFVVRPKQMEMSDPIHVIRTPDGRDSLWICERVL